MMSKLVPELRFKEFSGEWEEKHLNDISDIVRGGSPRPIDNYMTTDLDGLNWLKIGDVDKNSKYVKYTKERVKTSALSKTREVNFGDLILSNSMSFGRPYIMKIKSCIHDGWIAVTNIKENIQSDYLYYLILSPNSQSFFIDNAAGGGIRNLNADIIKSLPTYFPKSEKEQQKIASCLSSLDALIEATSKKSDALKKHKKGLMQQLFPSEGEKVPKLRFDGFSGEWEENILNDISDIVRGGSPRPIDNYMTTELGGLNWLKIGDVDKNSKYVTYTKERVKTSALSKTREVKFGDLILSNSMSFGRPYIMKIKSCIHDGWIAVTNIKENIHSDYLYYLILSPNSQKFFIDNAAGGGIKNLNADIIKSLPIFFPKDPNEQQKIAACLSSLDTLIEATSKKVEALKKHKKGLMQQMFVSGEA
ncbi:MAG: type I restriction enzyme, S subunit [Methyloprofundus sp.]|nr:MAG: type I restriction enzyme, S subunit [Methyloprofundus sp.]